MPRSGGGVQHSAHTRAYTRIHAHAHTLKLCCCSRDDCDSLRRVADGAVAFNGNIPYHHAIAFQLRRRCMHCIVVFLL
jgi:hypothetical protein